MGWVYTTIGISIHLRLNKYAYIKVSLPSRMVSTKTMAKNNGYRAARWCLDDLVFFVVGFERTVPKRST